MITLPTDRLHKFLAVAGLALVLLGVTVPLQKYQDAEVQRIEAAAKAREIHYAYGRYAEQVNLMISIYSEAVRKGRGEERSSEVRDKILSLIPEAEKLAREMEDLFVQSGKQLDLALHLERMRNLWFVLSAMSVLIGLRLAYVGFKAWLRRPADER